MTEAEYNNNKKPSQACGLLCSYYHFCEKHPTCVYIELGFVMKKQKKVADRFIFTSSYHTQTERKEEEVAISTSFQCARSTLLFFCYKRDKEWKEQNRAVTSPHPDVGCCLLCVPCDNIYIVLLHTYSMLSASISLAHSTILNSDYDQNLRYSLVIRLDNFFL